ncbi:MAG: putative phosphatase [Phycisphaerae bacterium]|nr:putative phosphatase [Phycisphaerae bacterium]
MSGGPVGAARTGAFFDVDGTLVGTTIVHYYAYLRTLRMSPPARRAWRAAFLVKCLGYLVLDRIDRTWFNRVFYRSYRRLAVGAAKAAAADCYRDVMRLKRFPEGVLRVERHRREGRRAVLVTGSIDFLIRPLAEELGADLIAARLLEQGDRFTGELDGPPISEGEKARRMRAYAEANAIDLSESFAYGDSIADLPMLEAVGHPVAVNPDAALEREAQRRGWTIETWGLGAGREQTG